MSSFTPFTKKDYEILKNSVARMAQYTKAAQAATARFNTMYGNSIIDNAKNKFSTASREDIKRLVTMFWRLHGPAMDYCTCSPTSSYRNKDSKGTCDYCQLRDKLLNT